MIPRILVTPGELAGIGPDIVLRAALSAWPAELVVIGDTAFFAERAKAACPDIRLSEVDLDSPPHQHVPGTLSVMHIPLNGSVETGKPDPRHAPHVIHCLKTAAALCLQGQAQAMVTGPVDKGIISAGGIPFTGHTEFLAQLAGCPLPVMLFVTGELRVALATTHLPLARVPSALTPAHLKQLLKVLHGGLVTRFGLPDPHLMICGLNPHAGEGGLLGEEENTIIRPVIAELRRAGLRLTGPVAADTVFTPYRMREADAILAMYHDQALPAVKCMDFGNTVNVTLGLPFVRTSVDHGIAADAAGTDRANPTSLMVAIRLAIDLSQRAAA